MKWTEKKLKVGQYLHCILGNGGCVLTNKRYKINRVTDVYWINAEFYNVYVVHGQSNFLPCYNNFQERTT